jgi:RNA 2',3'-cyclic 3'-phosphodiesterase
MPSDMVRSFIAGDIPFEIQHAIIQNTADLRNSLQKLIHWVAPQNIHLTFQFLGDVSRSDLARLAEVLKDEATAHAPIAITVAKIGAFPNPHRARVIWVGLEAPASLPALQQGIEIATARLGKPPIERGFFPHLTIGRVNRNATVFDLKKIYDCFMHSEIGVLGRFRMDALHLYKSDLAPGGPIYSRLYSMPLVGNNNTEVLPENS